MNIHTPAIDRKPSKEEAAEALALLRRWASKAHDAEIAALDPIVGRLTPDATPETYPAFARVYPEGFSVDAAYKDTLPDLQNGPSSLIRGQTVPSSMSAFPTFACRSNIAHATMATCGWKPR